ncbi:transporter [Arthrobacter sp. MYb224]|uniref:transporter n=1 Tax=Micrococcaceae TaxID=1268 RepID=UPI000CFC5398|nr:transporter [Arthrobacter sp. MYb224]PQZ97103.1 transporter [Arthrobacter sp. MYb224]
MVAYILKLKLRLLANGFKRSPWQLAGVIIGGLYALGMVVMLSLAMWFSADNLEARGWVSVLVGSVIVLGWAVIPPMITGVDLTLEPQRFVHFGIEAKTLARGLILAGFISVPAFLTMLAVLGFSTIWRLDPLALIVGLLCAIGTWVMAILLCQYLTIMATALRAKRRFRELSFGVLFLLLISLGPIITTIATNVESIFDLLIPATKVLAFTPLGAFAAVPNDFATGQFAALGLHLALALVYLAGLYLLLTRATGKATVTPPAAQRASSAKGLGFFKITPATPSGAVAARALTYWFKDPRYALSVIMVPMLPIIFYFASGTTGNYSMMLLLGPLIGILMGFSISADVSYDNTAFALHVLTGVTGKDDRLGRVLACFALVIVPLILAAVLPATLTGQPWRIPGDLGMSIGAFLIALGVASIASARYTYAVPLPGDNPMKTPPGNGARVALTQLATFGIMGVLLIPTLVPYIFGWVTQSMLAGYITVAVGLITGSIMLFLGIKIGGKTMDARQPELMQAVLVNR